MADPVATPVTRGRGLLPLLAAGGASATVGIFILLWFKLPAWAPQWVVEHSPFLDPVLRLTMEDLPFENRARMRIVGWGPAVVPALLARIDDRRVPIRGLVVRCLGELADARAAPALVTLLTADPESEVVVDAAKAMGQIGDRSAVPVLVSLAVSSPEPEVSIAAIDALGALGDARAIAPMVGMLRRKEAPWTPLALALAKLPHGEVANAILPLPAGSTEEDIIVFDVARRLDDPRVTAALDAVMREVPTMVPAPGRWFSLASRGEIAAACLVQAVHGTAVPAVLAAFTDPLEHVRRHAAAGVLMTYGRKLDQRLVPPLKAALEDPAPAVRQTAAMACRFVRVEGAEPLLFAMLAEPETYSRSLAAIGLGTAWASPQAIARVATMLDDGEPKVRRSAVAALEASAQPAALDALLAACPRVDGQLRQRILEALASKSFRKDPRVFPWLLQLLADPVRSRHESARRALDALTLDAAQAREVERVVKAWVEVPAKPSAK